MRVMALYDFFRTYFNRDDSCSINSAFEYLLERYTWMFNTAAIKRDWMWFTRTFSMDVYHLFLSKEHAFRLLRAFVLPLCILAFPVAIVNVLLCRRVYKKLKGVLACHYAESIIDFLSLIPIVLLDEMFMALLWATYWPNNCESDPPYPSGVIYNCHVDYTTKNWITNYKKNDPCYLDLTEFTTQCELFTTCFFNNIAFTELRLDAFYANLRDLVNQCTDRRFVNLRSPCVEFILNDALHVSESILFVLTR